MSSRNDKTSRKQKGNFVDDDDDDENPATTAEEGAATTTPATIPATIMDVLPSPSSLTNNDEVFQNFSTSTIAQIVQYSPSIVAVEVWTLDEETGVLVLEKGGSWTSPTIYADDSTRGVSLREDGASIPPGVDLAGTLWSAATSAGHKKKGRRMSTFVRSGGTRSLHWYNLEALLQDPDTAKGEEGHDGGLSNNRIEKYRALGIERVAGVPFESHDHQGIVVFMATASSSNEQVCGDDNILDLPEHDNLLHQIATVLSTTVAMQKTKLELIKKSAALGNSSHKLVQEVAKKCCPHCETVPGCVACTKKIKTVIQKSKGGGMPVPRCMSTPQSMFTWFGCFMALLVLSGIESILVRKTEFLLFAGPLGSLAMLQYGVTQAPTSQPRNAILSHIIAGPIAIAIRYIPGIPQWLRVSLGVSTASAFMTRLGIAHPPAAAMTALYLAPGNYYWQNYALTLMSVAISIVLATIINNFSDKRQYPTYWTGPLIKHLKNFLKKLHVSGHCQKENQEDAHNNVGKDAARCSI